MAIIEVQHIDFKYIDIMCRYGQKLYQIENILNDEQSSYLPTLNKKEWAYVFVGKDYKLIIPCKHIINRFYACNTKMKKALISGNIDDLYNSYTFKSLKNNSCYSIVSIDNTKICSSISALLLARIFYDKRIKDFFYYHFFQIATTGNSNLNLLKSYFPTFGKIQINGKYTLIKDSENKDTYILDSFSKYVNLLGPFYDIEYNRYKNVDVIIEKFSNLTSKEIASDKIYFNAKEDYFLGKEIFSIFLIDLEPYLINLKCTIHFTSEIQYTEDYIYSFENYDKFVIYNYGFYYILLEYNKKEYLVLVFDSNEIDTFWIFENYNLSNNETLEFLKQLFKFYFMTTMKVNTQNFTKLYDVNFNSVNKYSYNSPLLVNNSYELNIEEILKISVEEKYMVWKMDFNKKYPNSYKLM